LEWPKQAPKDFLKFRDAVTNAMESSHLTLEVEGNLMIIKTIAKRSPRGARHARAIRPLLTPAY